MKYLIFADVSADIDEQFGKEHDIHYIPMEYSLGDEMRTCKGVEPEEVMKAFYNGQRGGDLTKTSQISPYMYKSYLKSYFDEGYSILYLCLSSGLSSTYQSALMAKEELKEEYPNQDFYPVDTLAATGGMGVLAERAARNKEAGMDVEANFNDLVEAVKKIRHWFMVEDLMYLKRGGRVSAATAVVGSALNIKPILKIADDGKLVTIAKKRGTKSAVNELMALFEKTYDETAKDDVVSVVHADAPELAAEFKARLLEKYPDMTVRTGYLSPIIGAHTGPGMMAICHIGKCWE